MTIREAYIITKAVSERKVDGELCAALIRALVDTDFTADFGSNLDLVASKGREIFCDDSFSMQDWYTELSTGVTLQTMVAAGLVVVAHEPQTITTKVNVNGSIVTATVKLPSLYKMA